MSLPRFMNNKTSIILGINPTHNTSAAIMVDGAIVAAVQEERFSRRKNDRGLPIKSIEFCLSQAGVDVGDLTCVALPSEDEFPFLLSTLEDSDINKPQRLLLVNKIYHFLRYGILHNACYFWPKLSYLDWQLTLLLNHLVAPRLRRQYRELLFKYCGIRGEKISYFAHHQTHAASAYFASGFALSGRPTLVFTADGGGGDLAETVWICKGREMRMVSKTPVFTALAYMYMYTTMYLGLKPVEDEYKVMGLAPYAPRHKINEVVEKLNEFLYVDKRDLTFVSFISTNVFYKFLPKIYFQQRFDVIAAAIQEFCEQKVLEWVEAAYNKYKISQAVFSGGLFANVVVNQKIIEQSKLKKFFFMPSPGDESNCLGSCYLGYLATNKKSVPEGLDNLYLGPEFKNRLAPTILKARKLGFRVNKPKDINQVVVRLLSEGKIVARFIGRMEFGARALGNRSILADASRFEARDEINKFIKSRDFWMPFAPSILSSHEADYIKNPKKLRAPFMAVTFETTEKARKDLAAAIHPYNKTARAQIVYKEDNSDYFDLLEKYGDLGGKWGLLNTSFNLHGEPIVCTPSDALSTFTRSGLRYLQLENYIIEKRD